MRWKDQDVILEGSHHKVIYNQNFVSMPFMVMENTGVRISSYSSEQAAIAAVRYHDKKHEMSISKEGKNEKGV